MAYGFDFHKFDINRFDERNFEYDAQDELALSESYDRIIRKVIADGLNISDHLAGIVHDEMQHDALNLIETFSKDSDKTDEEVQAVVDNIARKAIKRVRHAELLDDVISKAIESVVSDGMSVSDQLAREMRSEVEADALSLFDSLSIDSERANQDIQEAVDELAQHVVKRLYDELLLDDIFEKTFEKLERDGISLPESVSVMVQKEFESTAIELIEASDLPEFTLDKHDADTEDIVDNLAKIISKQLPTDSDELSDDSHRVIVPHHYEQHGTSDDARFDVTANWSVVQGVSDRISTGTVDYGAIVYVDGYRIRVDEGLVINNTSNDRVSVCSFELKRVEPWLIDILHIRADVHVVLFDGNETEYFGGRIVSNPVTWRGYAPIMRVEAEDYTATANDQIVNQSYKDEYVHDIVYNMWTEFYRESIEFDIQQTNLTIPVITFQFETLFDATETLADHLGWIWYVDWDGGKRTLRFFSPDTNVFPDRLGWGEKNVLESGFEFGRDYDMYNALYYFGGEALSDFFTEKEVADGERYLFSFTYEPTEITILVDGVQQRIGIENIHNFDDDDVDCLVNYQEKALRFPEDSPPSEGAIIEKTYRYRYPIVTYVEDNVSIERYGRITKEIREPKITDINLAQERAGFLLRENSMPNIFGKMQLRNVYGLRAGHVAEVHLPNIGVTGFFTIAEVQKIAMANRVEVSVSVNKIENPESQIAAKLKDFAKRIKALEMDGFDEDAVVHRYQQEYANLIVTEDVSVSTRTAGVTLFDFSEFNYADFA